MIRVLLAEDQAMMRGALAALLALEDDIEVVAEAGRGRDVVPAALMTRPDVALLDIEMPDGDGLTAAADLRARLPGCRVLILTTFGRPGYLQRALASGVMGFVVKDAPATQLAEAIRRVVNGERVIDASLAADALTEGRNPLTERERMVLIEARGGGLISDIARALFLSEGTVRNYLSEAIQKLEARNRMDAARIAEQKGWLAQEEELYAAINAFGNRALHAALPADLWSVYSANMGAPVHGLRFMTERMRSLASVDWELPADPVGADCRVSRARLVQILRAGLQDELRMGKKLVRYAHVGERVEACFEDGSMAAGDVLIGADGFGSSVRQQLLPEARVLDLDIVGLGGKCALTPDSRQWLPATLIEKMNVVLPPAGRGMFVTSFVRPPAAPTDGAYAELKARDLEDHVFWALIARRGTFGLEGAGHSADPAHLKALALRLVDTWHPNLQRMVADTEASGLTAIPLQTAAPVAAWETRNVTLLGDAVHTMTPLQGLGGNTALRDASLLCERLVSVSRGQAGLTAALHSYEATMLRYGFAAARDSLAQTQNFVSANRLGREIFKGVLRVADAIPPLKQRMFRAPGE